jgi:CheY-like chemotaxis protein
VSPGEAAARPRANLLLVDDRTENLLALEAILEPLGERLVRAASGEEALRAMLHEEFAAILLDVQMPGMDGYETAALISRASAPATSRSSSSPPSTRTIARRAAGTAPGRSTTCSSRSTRWCCARR